MDHYGCTESWSMERGHQGSVRVPHGLGGPGASGHGWFPEGAEQNLTAWTLPTAPERSRAAGEPQFGGPGEGCGEQGSGAATVLLG